MDTTHECTVQDAGWRLLAECPDDGSGSTVLAVTVGAVLLGAVGFGVWWLVSKRF